MAVSDADRLWFAIVDALATHEQEATCLTDGLKILGLVCMFHDIAE